MSPLTARTQADRDLVALVFSGLVRNGPSGTVVPDLAERWTVDESGSVWTFQLREDATWHDGHPVTSADVLFTIHRLQDPAYTGPAAGSWNEVTVAADGPYTVVFTLKTPLGGFLQAATQPIAPAHLLADVPSASSRPTLSAVIRSDRDRSPSVPRRRRGELVPAATVGARRPGSAEPPTDPAATPGTGAPPPGPARTWPAWTSASSIARTRSRRRTDAASSTRCRASRRRVRGSRGDPREPAVALPAGRR